MKEDFDREVDSLLRRRARGTAEFRSPGAGAGNGVDGAHLDADELGAFAEGALPAAARLAAVSHLADCERCRGVVVGLARVTGGGAELKKQAVAIPASTEAARPSSWRALVASLFAPRVMRFAVPLLALSLVGVVSYVALRSNSGGAMRVATDAGRQNAASNERAAAPAASTTGTMNANSVGLTDQNADVAQGQSAAPSAPPAAPKGHGSAEGRPADADATGENERPVAAPPPPAPVAAATEGPAEIAKAAPRPAPVEESEGAKADREKSENRDKSARSAENVDEVAVNDLSVQQQRRVANSRAGEVQMPDGGSRNQQKRSADNNASSGYGNVGGADNAAAPKESPRNITRSESAGRGRAAKPAPERKDSEDDDARSGETRSAAGHRFRREGNVWVDVNYKPSMSSTGVRRGTEPFRALVADVPEVGRVAEAVSGEVIVVVRGRAYRIR